MGIGMASMPMSSNEQYHEVNIEDLERQLAMVANRYAHTGARA
jgi:hypothetical protein